MRILFYYQWSDTSVAFITLIKGFRDLGHDVFVLTTSPKGTLHKKLEAMGIQAFSSDNGSPGFSYFHHFRKLVSFCRSYNIDVVYPQLQNANLVALCSRPLIRAKVFATRHHADDVLLSGNKKMKLIDSIVNLLSSKLIVVSEAVRQQLVKEGMKTQRVEVIRLGYDFSLYPQVDLTVVQSIKETVPCQLRLVMIGRMTANKNHLTALRAMHKLVTKGLSVKLLFLGTGPDEQVLKQFVAEHNMQSDVLFAGQQENVVNYIAASHLLLHPSLSEASNQVVREAALQQVPSVVVEGVGDFGEYIVPFETGFVLPRQSFEKDLVLLLEEIYLNKYNLSSIGQAAEMKVRDLFGAQGFAHRYLQLMHPECSHKI